MLGQRRVDDGSNEIVALAELVALLALEKDMAQAIVARGGDLLALKANQPALYDDLRLLLDDLQARRTTSPPPPTATTDGSRPPRRGPLRRCLARESHASRSLSAVGKVTAARERDGQTTTASRYYLLSRPLSAVRLAACAASLSTARQTRTGARRAATSKRTG